MNIVAANHGGLGNRIKCFWSACMLFGEAQIHWPAEWFEHTLKRKFPCTPFKELFNEAYFENTSPWDDLRIDTWRLWWEENIDFQYEKIPEQVRRSYLAIVQRTLSPKSMLWQRALDVLGDCTRGYHIRTHHTEVRDLDLRTIQTPCFVCTDNVGQRMSLSLMPGVRINTWATDSWLGALVDMLALSQCSETYVPRNSTFAEVAWWLGGAKGKVITR